MRTGGSGDRDWQFLDWGAGGGDRSFQEGHKEKVTFEGREGTSYLDIGQPPIPVANTAESSSLRPLGMISFVHPTPGAPTRLRGRETGKTFDLDSVLQGGGRPGLKQPIMRMPTVGIRQACVPVSSSSGL